MSLKLLIVIIIAIAIVASLLVYFYLFGESRNSAAPSRGEADEESPIINPAEGVVPESEIREAGEVSKAGSYEQAAFVVSEEDAASRLEKFQKIIASATVAPTLSADKKRILYYDAIEKNFYAAAFTGTDPIEMTGEDFTEVDIDEIVWAPNKDKLVYKTLDDEKIFFKIGDEVSKELSSNISNYVFSNDSVSLFYKYTDGNKSNISRGTPESGLADFRSIKDVMATDVVLRRVPNEEFIAYFLPPNGRREAGVNKVSYDGSITEVVLNKGYGVDAVWSLDGDKVVFSRTNSKGVVKLFVGDGNGLHEIDTELTTFVDKTAWSKDGKLLYAAVPETILDVEKYYGKKIKTKDKLYEINTGSGAATLLLDFAAFDEKIDMRDMFLTDGGNLLYFRNNYDDSVYVVNIKKIKEEMEEI
ncbi:MAG: hypothetical protein ACD_63C00137G0002 [uncultured bacterium]|nr:MAG: hypothetical protein ACD_63C00137G0002 [uncultured bacterium]